MNSHLDDDDAAALAEGSLGARDRQAAEVHLADCEDCRSLVLAAQAGLSAAPGVPAPLRRYAVAAAVLVLVGMAATWFRPRSLPQAPPPRSSSRGVRLASGVVEGLPWAALSENLAVELPPGSRLSPLPGGWRLEAGEAWWTSQGAGPVRLEAAGMVLELHGPAVLGVRLIPAPAVASAWTGLTLGQAEAAAPAPPVEVWVEEGVVTGIVDGKPVQVPAGHRWRPGEPGPRRVSVSAMASAFAWRQVLGRLSDSPPRLLGSVRERGSGWAFSGPGSLLYALPPGAAYRLNLELAATEAPVAAGISCQFGGEAAVWELPSSLWDARPHRVTVEASPLGVRVLVDGVLMRAMGRGAFRANQLAAMPGAGLVVWGGAVRVSSSSLRLLESSR